MLGFEKVSKRFGAHLALDEFDVAAHPGSITALIGPNGAGKSTAFRIAVGLLEADSGSVLWRGDQLRKSLAGSRIGFLPEERGLYQEAHVEPLLRYWGTLRGLSLATSASAASRWLERLGLCSKRKQLVRNLSKGNQQKVQLAACLLHEPDLLVLDEPFSGLDPENQELVCGVIQAQRDRGAIIMMSAHQLPLVERLADEVVLLSMGKVRKSPFVNVFSSPTPPEQHIVKVQIHEIGDLPARIPSLGGECVETSAGYLRIKFKFSHASELFNALAELSRSTFVRGVDIERNDLHQRYLGVLAGLSESGANSGR
jgi:ABC-2 type transport system ATP-binding protein